MVAISSAIISLFTYFQNIGITIDFPNIPLPPEMKKILSSIKNFLGTIQQLIPKIPAFDIRCQLVIMALGIPCVLDIFFVWFIQPFLTTLFHIIDIAALIACALFLTMCLSTNNFQIVSIVIAAITGIYLLVRIIYICCCKKKQTSFGLYDLCKKICNHFMRGVVPDAEKTTSTEDINEEIKRYSAIIEIKPSKPSVIKNVFIFLFAVILLLFGLWCSQVLPIPYTLPATVRLFCPYIAYPLSGILLIALFLKFCECGRKFSVSLKNFFMRWGLRLLMLALDLLYIPILTGLVTHVTPSTNVSCPAGYYARYNQTLATNSLAMFIQQKMECLPCNFSMDLSTSCFNQCHQKAKDLRMMDDPALRFIPDILTVSGGVIIFTVLAVMIGVPSLWYYVIKRNQQFVYLINVYGEDPETKWKAIVNRMHTTGIFMFVNYKASYARWNVFLLLTKFVVMVISTIAGRIWKWLLFALPIFYIIVFISTLCKKPYLYGFNNFLDSVLFFVNAVFSTFPLVALFGVYIPNAWSLPITIVLFIIPVLSIIFLLFFKKKTGLFAENDPTLPVEFTEEEMEKREKKRIQLLKKRERQKKAKRAARAGKAKAKGGKAGKKNEKAKTGKGGKKGKKKHQKKNTTSDSGNKEVTSDGADPFVIIEGNNNVNPYATVETPLLTQDLNATIEPPRRVVPTKPYLDNKDRVVFPEDNVDIEPGMLDNIQDSLYSYRKKYYVNPDEVVQTVAFTTNKIRLSEKMKKMYELLDIVIDGSTIELLTKILNYAVMAAGVAFGWYIGALLSHDFTNTTLKCN